MVFVAEGKPNAPRAATPAEVARTMMARAREAPTIRGPKARGDSEHAPDRRERPTEASGTERTSGVHVKRDAEETVAPEGDGSLVHSLDALAHGRYARITVLGQGGMGRVDEVFDHVLGRPVAKKSLLQDLDEDRASMLIAEAQICAQLEHPSIVPVYDLDAGPDGRPFYTMRVVRGRTLRDVLADNESNDEERTPLAQVLGIFRQVCLAVDYAHDKGVVHRDLKPDNVIVGEFGEVYVVDWGIAHVVQGSSVRLTGHSPSIAGTPAYMAPEQLFGEGVDSRADVFALGVMLYEILAGSRPFSDESILGVRSRRRQLVEEPPSRRGSTEASPGFFDDLVLSCLSPDRKARPGRARVIASAIDEYLDAERERAEREREAEEHVRRGMEALGEFERLDAKAADLSSDATELLAKLEAWAESSAKRAGWDVSAEAAKLRSAAARALARAETELARAVGRVPNHAEARKGLARLHYWKFLDAEAAGATEQMARYLDLARVYDDGDLALELANRGTITVATDESCAEVSVARVRPVGPLLTLGEYEPALTSYECGSYVLRAVTRSGRVLRYPLVVQRAMHHSLRLRIPKPTELPDDMELVAAGPFLGELGRRELVDYDFCIGRFPVTFREYCAFLDELPDEVRERRMPRLQDRSPCVLRCDGRWTLAPQVVEGEARSRVSRERELDLPASGLRWWDAVAYSEWLHEKTGRAFRLPTELEWDKAMRGADGRPFPMGVQLDASFAKLRQSRPEPSQPEPIGTFELDESPYGVRDLAGGVGDWTASFIDGAPPPSAAEESDEAANERQAIWRGLTWSSAANVNTNMRYSQAARTWAGWIGFRLALTVSEHGSSELLVEPMKR